MNTKQKILKRFNRDILRSVLIIYTVTCTPIIVIALNTMGSSEVNNTFFYLVLIESFFVGLTLFMVQNHTVKKIKPFLRGETDTILPQVKAAVYNYPFKAAQSWIFCWIVLINSIIITPLFIIYSAPIYMFIPINLLLLSGVSASVPISFLICEQTASEFLSLKDVINVPDSSEIKRFSMARKNLIVNLSVLFAPVFNIAFVLFLILVVNDTNRNLVSDFTVIIIQGVVLSITISYYYSKSVKKPIEGIIKSIYEQLDTEQVVLPKFANDELGDTCDAFNKVFAELKRAETQAKIGLQVKSDFLANMSHEIRTPMNGVIGMTHILIDSQLNSEQQVIANAIQSSGETLLTLLNDILDYSKIESGKLELESISFNIHEMLYTLLYNMSFQLGKKDIELIFQIDPNVPRYVQGDPGRLKQVLTNIIGNAIKFTEKGDIYITCKKQKTHSSGELLLFSIHDTGIGIAKKNQDKLFDKFTQADESTTRNFGGTGLGLAISQEIVKLMNGNIGLESELGKGTNFWFTVLLESSPKDAPLTIEFPEQLNIISVDKNSKNRDLIKEILNRNNITNTIVENGKKALHLIKEAKASKNSFTHLITDYFITTEENVSFAKKVIELKLFDEKNIIILKKNSHNNEYQTFDNVKYVYKPVYDKYLLSTFSLSEFNIDFRNKNDIRQIINSDKSKINCKILIAEDNKVNQLVVEKMLEKMGYKCDIVENGQEAIRQLKIISYDMLFVDLQMPVMGGLETTKNIRMENSVVINQSIPIIAMTANAMRSDKEKCLKSGMNDYLSKPINPIELNNIIRKWSPQ